MKVARVTHSRVRRHRLQWVIGVFLLSMLVITVRWYDAIRNDVSSDDAYTAGNVVIVEAQTPGIVAHVYADVSMPVRAGQRVLSEQGNLTRMALEQASAKLAEAVRQTSSLFAQSESESANIATLNAQKIQLQADLDRYQHALSSGAVSAQQVSDTQLDVDIINSKIRQAAALMHKSLALVHGTSLVNNPLILQARAAFITAYIQYQRMNVCSPVTGYVAERPVQIGAHVVPGQRLMAIVPLNQLWVTANIKETQLAHVRTGESVIFHSYVYGDDVTFHGTVLGIAPAGGSTFSLFPPNNSTGNYIHIVERVSVRIGVVNAELAAHPLPLGTSVNVEIDTRRYRTLALFNSYVAANDASYTTHIYEEELHAAAHAAKQIISSNTNVVPHY